LIIAQETEILGDTDLRVAWMDPKTGHSAVKISHQSGWRGSGHIQPDQALSASQRGTL